VVTQLENVEKSRNFTLVRISQGNCGLPVMYYHSCDSHKINIIRVLLSKVKLTCTRWTVNNATIFTQEYTYPCVFIYLWWFNIYYCLRGKYLEKSGNLPSVTVNVCMHDVELWPMTVVSVLRIRWTLVMMWVMPIQRKCLMRRMSLFVSLIRLVCLLLSDNYVSNVSA